MRELYEETGIESNGLVDCRQQQRFAIRPEWRARYAPHVRENTEHVFRLELDDRVSVQLNPAEHNACLWLPIDAAADKVFSWTNRDAILALL